MPRIAPSRLSAEALEAACQSATSWDCTERTCSSNWFNRGPDPDNFDQAEPLPSGFAADDGCPAIAAAIVDGISPNSALEELQDIWMTSRPDICGMACHYTDVIDTGASIVFDRLVIEWRAAGERVSNVV